ncbi:MAG TPA: hypothetical protein VFX02_06320 [Gammaproteobacteria bacterium]|nr:hypothetical protein [Gammaproteobacteria bacterium]
MLQPLAENGVWTLFGSTPTGFALYGIWFMEGLIIAGFSTLMAYSGLKDLPFCERCGLWTQSNHTSSPLEPAANTDKLISQVEQNDFSSLTSLQKLDPSSQAYTQIELHQCPGCKRDGYLTLKSVVMETDSKGKNSKQQTTILGNLILNNESYTAVKAIG